MSASSPSQGQIQPGRDLDWVSPSWVIRTRTSRGTVVLRPVRRRPARARQTVQPPGVAAVKLRDRFAQVARGDLADQVGLDAVGHLGRSTRPENRVPGRTALSCPQPGPAAPAAAGRTEARTGTPALASVKRFLWSPDQMSRKSPKVKIPMIR